MLLYSTMLFKWIINKLEWIREMYPIFKKDISSKFKENRMDIKPKKQTKVFFPF